jgi:hypothetical protein
MHAALRALIDKVDGVGEGRPLEVARDQDGPPPAAATESELEVASDLSVTSDGGDEQE